jgi:predicted tellurium resistance membrane protein TerC
MFGKNIPVKHIAIYSLVMITCAFYGSGDNYGYSVAFAILITYVFYPLLHYTWKKVQLIPFFLLLFFFVVPFILAFVSYTISSAILNMIPSHESSTEMVILIMIYLILSDMFVLLVWRKRTGEERSPRHPHAI